MSPELVEQIFWNRRPQIRGIGTASLVLQMLAANGLAEETLKSAAERPQIGNISSRADAERALADFLKELAKPVERHYRLSPLGMDFLKFVGSEHVDQAEQSPPSSA